jgi:hypothetical protein
MGSVVGMSAATMVGAVAMPAIAVRGGLGLSVRVSLRLGGDMHLGLVIVGVVMLTAVTMAMVTVAVVGDMATIGAAFGLKGLINLHHGQVHAAQHAGQNMVGFDLEVVGLQFDGHMAVAQVVGGAHQIKGAAVGGAGRDAQHLLRCGDHAHHTAVFGHQHITAAHGLAAWQEDGQGAALAVGGGKAAFLAHVPVELYRRGASEQHRGEALALGEEFGDLDHGEVGAWAPEGEIRIVGLAGVGCAVSAHHS